MQQSTAWMPFDCGSRERHVNIFLSDKNPALFSPIFWCIKKWARRIAPPCNKYQPINGETKQTFGNVFSGFAAITATIDGTAVPGGANLISMGFLSAATAQKVPFEVGVSLTPGAV